MNLAKSSKIIFLLFFACISQMKAEQISSDELKTVLEKTTGITIPAKPGAGKAAKHRNDIETLHLLLSPFTYKDKAFPRERLNKELMENYALFDELGMDLPRIMTSFINKQGLTDTELLLAVRISRVINAKIPSPKKEDENGSQ